MHKSEVSLTLRKGFVYEECAMAKKEIVKPDEESSFY